MGGVREGKNFPSCIAGQAKQISMRRAGNSDQKVASSVGLWLKEAPLPPTPSTQGDLELRIWALHLHSCSPGAWPKDANSLFGGLNACAQGSSVYRGARDQSLPMQCTSYTVSALLQHTLPVPAGAWFW